MWAKTAHHGHRRYSNGGGKAVRDWYETIPLAIIVTDELIVTVCMEDSLCCSLLWMALSAVLIILCVRALFCRFYTVTRHVLALSAYYRPRKR